MIFRSDVPKFASNNMNQVTAKAATQRMTANYGTWSIDADELKYTNPASQIGSVDDVVWKRAK
jgi:hypothetical protein